MIPNIVQDIQNLQDNRKDRVSHMMNEIDEDKFKSIIMKNHIDYNVKQELMLLYQLVQNFGADLFNEYVTRFNQVNTYYSNYGHFEELTRKCMKNNIGDLAENGQLLYDLTSFWDEKIRELSHLCQYFNEQTQQNIYYIRSNSSSI